MLINRAERQKAADPMARIYEDLEVQLMANIVRHIRDYGRPVDSDNWRIQKMAEMDRLNQENIRIIAGSAGITQKEARQMCLQMAGLAADRADRLMSDGDERAGRKKTGGLRSSVEKTVQKVYRQIRESLDKTNTVMLRKAKKAYRSLVWDICFKAEEISKKRTFREALQEEAAAETIGIKSRTQAIEDALRYFNEKGIAAFVDKSGKNWAPDAYVSMVLRTEAQNAASEAVFARMEERGFHLLQVSSHSGARPKCARDQGKIFDREDGEGVTTDRNGKQIPYYPFSSSSYGEPDGLFGINCGHHGAPFIPGVSRERYTPTGDLEENDEEYRKVQIQRELERKVRKQKRLCMLYREAGDENALYKARLALREKEARLRAYVGSQEGLERRPEREQVLGWDKKDTGAGIRQGDRKIAIEEISGIGYTDSKEEYEGFKRENLRENEIITDGSHIEKRRLKPNITYRTGEHDYLYRTDEKGRIVYIQAEKLEWKKHEGRLAHDSRTPEKRKKDQAGHLIADMFGGSPKLDNLVSQAKGVNLKKYRDMERQWERAVKEGRNVTVDIKVNYREGRRRPESFEVIYVIDGTKFKRKINNQ